MKTLKITIDKDGKVQIDALGYSGAECGQATAELERALGTSGKRNLKPERFLQGAAQKARTGI